ncbi:MAG: hypothetical protein SOZ54_07325 [Candidatus Limiplasma sp.]|nr:hypothetical protein [Clostridiales bacterium]MDY3816622.1 hypothetical protein [Candidatus Limiplasma sp.]
MLPEMEMLQYVYKTADMGCEGIDAVESHAEEKLLKELKRERAEYEHIRGQADQLIRRRGDMPGGTGPMAKLSADLMSAIQMSMDDSRGKIAEMMIQGTTMGIVKTIRHLRDYDGQDDEPRALGQRLLDTQESNVEKMKAYL